MQAERFPVRNEEIEEENRRYVYATAARCLFFSYLFYLWFFNLKFVAEQKRGYLQKDKNMERRENMWIAVSRSAMEYGIYLGVFFIVKFVITTLSVYIPALSIISLIMTVAIPFLLYKFMMMYADHYYGSLSFIQYWLFGILLFFFASLICGVVNYIYYQYVNPDFLNVQISALMNQLNSVESLKNTGFSDFFRETLEKNGTPTAIQMTIQTIWSTVFWGALLSVVIGLIALWKNRY